MQIKLPPFTKEIVLSFILIGILGLFLTPLQLLMPMSSHTTITVLFIIAFLIFVALVWNEKSLDERDNIHKLFAGRVSYLVGTTLLATGVIVESITLHEIDPWLIFSLGAMILVKILTRLYSQIKQ